MNRYMDTDRYSRAGDWLIGTAKRNPEALLVLAAGCALLLRSGKNSRGSHLRRRRGARLAGASSASGTRVGGREIGRAHV